MAFNLIIAGNRKYWDSKYIKFPLERLFEYTDYGISSWLSPISKSVNLKELESYPTLLAYELRSEEEENPPAKLVSLRELRISGQDIIFRWEDRSGFTTIPEIFSEEMRFKLRIDSDFEMHRTHWAVKEGDLLEILKGHRIGKRDDHNISKQTAPSKSNHVFLVHGHDTALLETTARFLEKIGLQPIILKEQADGGRTIIEKFEDHAEQASYAVALLTPDDYGSANDEKSTRHRARQNVILELGYFAGALGRNRVCALKKGDLELPNDILGVLWKSVDETDAWKLELAKELRHAGLPVDASALIS